MINAAFVRESKPRAKMYEVTCDALPGFILRVLPTGKKVALVRYRSAGKEHRERIGLLGPTLTIDEARRRAANMLADVAASESGDETVGQAHRRPCGTAGTSAILDRHAPIPRRALRPGACRREAQAIDRGEVPTTAPRRHSPASSTRGHTAAWRSRLPQHQEVRDQRVARVAVQYPRCREQHARHREQSVHVDLQGPRDRRPA